MQSGPPRRGRIKRRRKLPPTVTRANLGALGAWLVGSAVLNEGINTARRYFTGDEEAIAERVVYTDAVRERERYELERKRALLENEVLQNQLTRGRVELAKMLQPPPPPPPAGAPKPAESAGTLITPAMIEEKKPVGFAEKTKAKLRALVSSPLFMATAAAVLPVLLTRSSSPGRAYTPPSDFPPVEEPPLTGFEPEGVTYLGAELGGLDVTQLDQLAATEPAAETAPDKCEKVSPKRTKGQCRQGWFSETPTQLILKEWSRRPCQ